MQAVSNDRHKRARAGCQVRKQSASASHDQHGPDAARQLPAQENEKNPRDSLSYGDFLLHRLAERTAALPLFHAVQRCPTLSIISLHDNNLAFIPVRCGLDYSS
jgi:hypothetical protein